MLAYGATKLSLGGALYGGCDDATWRGLVKNDMPAEAPVAICRRIDPEQPAVWQMTCELNAIKKLSKKRDEIRLVFEI